MGNDDLYKRLIRDCCCSVRPSYQSGPNPFQPRPCENMNVGGFQDLRDSIQGLKHGIHPSDFSGPIHASEFDGDPNVFDSEIVREEIIECNVQDAGKI